MGIIHSEANPILAAAFYGQKLPSHGPHPKMKFFVGPFLGSLKVPFECFLYCGLLPEAEAGIISATLPSYAAGQALPELER